jgi:hypothetical protein
MKSLEKDIWKGTIGERQTAQLTSDINVGSSLAGCVVQPLELW